MPRRLEQAVNRFGPGVRFPGGPLWQHGRHGLHVGPLFDRFPEVLLDIVVIRWMAAQLSGDFQRDAQAVQLYQQVMQSWKPGPVAAHRSFGDVLGRLENFDQELSERQAAIGMEDSPFNQYALANALSHLRRFHDANEAYDRATKMDSHEVKYWAHWAVSLQAQGDLAQAIKKCERMPRRSNASSPTPGACGGIS